MEICFQWASSVERIQAKYEIEDLWITKTVTSTYGSSHWRAIRNHWPKLRENCSIKLGNGRKTSFWEDRWLEQGSSSTLFPNFFTLNQQQRATVAEMWSNQGWNLSFRRPLNDWEIQRLVEFYKVLGQFKGTIDAQDSMVWQDHNRDNFSVRRAYKKFNPCNSQGNGWPWKLI